ncbi:HlyD family secretion protein [filamentous cyanobacterium CCP3]|nr:HlyD family secretion protein [filamentous cyanobacterium CCP3]
MSAYFIRLWQKRGFWILLVGILVMGGVLLFVVRDILQTRREASQSALSVPEQFSVAALGRVEPANGVIDLAASRTGRLGGLMVRKGDIVEADQILAYLDTYEVSKAERDYAASQLSEARAELVARTALGSSQIEEARTRIAQIDEPQRAAIQAQEATIQSLQAELDVAEIDLERFQRLNQSGAVSRQELDRQQATVNRLRAELDNAKATKQRLEQSRAADVENAVAQMRSTEANLTLAQVQSRVSSAEQNLAKAQSELDLTIIRAPKAGQILNIYADPGEAVSPSGEPILAMGDTSQMYVVAEVYETDVNLVRVGQTATITSRNGAFTETLTGTVEEIGLEIAKNDVLDDDPAANADARVVETRIRVNQSNAIAGLTNLQVEVVIDIDS